MTEPHVLDFSSAWTSLGTFSLGAFAVLALLGSLGCAALWLTKRRRTSGMLTAAGLQGAVVVGLVALVSHRAAQFQSLTIEADGTWRLEDGLGRDLLVLTPTDMRAVDLVTSTPVGAGRTEEVTRVRIELPDGRTFVSVPSTAEAELATLRRLVAKHQ